MSAAVTQRADALALGIGSRVTASTLLVGCVLALVLGASSMVDSLHSMDRDLKAMNKQLAEANAGTAILNQTLDSLPPTRDHLHQIVRTVEQTSAEAKRSSAAVVQLADTTDQLNTGLAGIAEQTTSMRGSLESVDSSTSGLVETVTALDQRIDPLARTQHDMLTETGRMGGFIGAMNGSLAYVIRTVNYMSAPPTGGGFTVRVDLDKKTLPPVPGVKAQAEPVQVFERGAWPTYTGP